MMIKNFFAPGQASKQVDIGLFILRVGISILMMGHGFQKLSRYLEGNTAFADPIGIGSEATLILAIFVEMIGSILLILGLFTRAVLLFLGSTMLVVTFIVHAADPFKVKELAIAFLLVYLVMFITGPGQYSIDQKLYGKKFRISSF
ncbi:putative oxidoreductase [Dyadobacter jejuensis]|uniref:Putative oxidoreductase n=1 Tax=Dyadobacter jejuensis TaxID=1082580 RepID=A0A316AT05_9BACT|nr:DoxX family protein [Dyadobacter jejuensis]PWJ60439.1 putative oxidoreductase [Dyadobacter jejuensis]